MPRSAASLCCKDWCQKGPGTQLLASVVINNTCHSIALWLWKLGALQIRKGTLVQMPRRRAQGSSHTPSLTLTPPHTTYPSQDIPSHGRNTTHTLLVDTPPSQCTHHHSALCRHAHTHTPMVKWSRASVSPYTVPNQGRERNSTAGSRKCHGFGTRLWGVQHPPVLPKSALKA